MKTLLALLFILVLLSCSASKKLDSWIGSTKKEVVMRYGPPEMTTTDTDGGEIITYTNSYNAGYANTVWTTTQFLHFYLGKDGLVYHCLYNKSREPIPVIQVIQPFRPAPVAFPKLD